MVALDVYAKQAQRGSEHDANGLHKHLLSSSLEEDWELTIHD